MADAPTSAAIDVVTRFGEAWGNHDLDATMALVHPDALFDATGPAPDGAEHHGHDAIRAAWQAIFDDVSATFTVESTFVAADDRVVQTWRYDWGDGHVRGVDLFAVRDGLVSEKRSYVKG
ncbi:MAG: nuclear transport factor 2 family protein [Acidimicrobiales bacterium]|nr:nuclear transport factor 2 family protein [Acidimicrobiales bacterium]